jgi:cytochrome b6-f complex iron-sulfur subunit
MNRKEFLAQLGTGGVAVFAAACLQGCSKTSGAPSNVDFQLDLTSSANSALKTAGGYVINQGVIVAYTTSGTYLAVSAACPHEGLQVQFKSSNNQFVCNAHNSFFSSNGARISGPANTGLKQYKTSLTGNILRVYS